MSELRVADGEPREEDRPRRLRALDDLTAMADRGDFGEFLGRSESYRPDPPGPPH